MALPHRLLALVAALVIVGALTAPALAATDAGSTVAATATPAPDGDGMMVGENMSDDGNMSDGSMADGNMTDESMDDESMSDESMDDGSMADESMGEEIMTDESMSDGSMDDSMTDSMADAGDDAAGASSTPGQPGFGLLVAVVALLGAGLLAARRRG